MRIFIIIAVLIVVYTMLGSFSNTNQNQDKEYTVIGQVYVRYNGGMPDPFRDPPFPEDDILPVENSECLRFYSDPMFDSSTSYKPVVTDGSGYYKIVTNDSCFAIVLMTCADQGWVLDTLRNFYYEKLNIVDYGKIDSDTIYFIDTLYYMRPS